MRTPSVVSLRRLARRLRKPPASILVIAVAVIIVAGGTAIALVRRPTNDGGCLGKASDPRGATRTGAGEPPVAGRHDREPRIRQGSPPARRTAGSEGGRCPQEHLTAQEWAAVPKPGGSVTSAGTKGNASPSTRRPPRTQARSTSSCGRASTSTTPRWCWYFDAADPGISGWQSWFATVFDPDTGAAQDSRPLPPSNYTACQAPAQLCHSFGAADGWSLVGGHQYFATITMSPSRTTPRPCRPRRRSPPRVPPATRRRCRTSRSAAPAPTRCSRPPAGR